MKNFKKFLFADIILLVVYSIFVWLIPYPKNDYFTLIFSYISGIVAIAMQLYISYLALHNAEDLKSKLYGWPIIKIGFIYGIVQVTLSIIFIIISIFIKVPAWITIVLYSIIFLLVILGLVITDSYRESIEKIEEAAPFQKEFILNLRIESAAFSKKVNSEPLHSLLVKFAELVKYSDPISSDGLIDIENEISRKYKEVKDLAVHEKLIEAKHLLEEVIELLEERNNKCKILK